MKHTPGPWNTIGYDSTIRGRHIKGPNGESIAYCYNPYSFDPRKVSPGITRDKLVKEIKIQGCQNAKLIAAAPDLLEACQVSYNQIELEIKRRNDWGLSVPKGLQTAYLMLSDSINKATGAK